MDRRKEDSVALILRSAIQGTTRPRLMYETYLPYEVLNEYLSSLICEGLMEYRRGEMKFKTTRAGRQFLSAASVESECAHQCKKCGVVYGCQIEGCNALFQGGTCTQCSKFITSEIFPEKAAATVVAKSTP